jgi:hypothetical protein
MRKVCLGGRLEYLCFATLMKKANPVRGGRDRTPCG